MTRTAVYRETFFRHRRLLLLPTIVAVMIAAWAATSSPKSYMSTASLWVDNPASTDSSLGNLNPGILPPAQQEQQTVAELLATRQFTHAVALRSGLLRYLASHNSSGSGPSALLSALGGQPSLDSRTAAALNATTVTMSVRGPQVLGLGYVGPTPAIAQSTLGAIVTELQHDSALFASQHNAGAIAYDRSRVRSAARAVTTARDQLNAYLSQHHNAGSGDPTLTALQTAQSVASSQLTQANANLTTAASAARSGGDTGSSARVVDAASVPSGPTSGNKKQLLAIFGGLFAGLLISFLGVLALSPKAAVRWEDDDPERVLDPLESSIAGDGVESELPTNGTSVLAHDDVITSEGDGQGRRGRRLRTRTPS